MKLNDIIGMSLHLLRGERYGKPKVGIELEYEQYNGNNIMGKGWNVEGDPSLRENGLELVSIPTWPKDVERRLLVGKQLAEAGGLKATSRCGVHVHLNARHMTWGQLWTMSMIYTVLEPTIFKRWAPDREVSHFCVPTFCNTLLVEHMASDMQHLKKGLDNGWRPELLNTSKYCAMSFYRLHDLGTVEFRQLEGSLDMALIQRWIELLLRIQEAAMPFESPAAFLELYNGVGRRGLCRMVQLDFMQVDELDQEDAEAAAKLMCGYDSPEWDELEWGNPEEL